LELASGVARNVDFLTYTAPADERTIERVQ